MGHGKIAIVHHWLVIMRGGEKVVEALCRMYPEADIFTHVYDPQAVSPTIRAHKVSTTFINRLPLARKLYQLYLPLMPMALEQLDLRGYDLIISIESGPSKGIICDPDAVHVCYCNTPMRYLWDQYHEYVQGFSWLRRRLMAPLLHYLRLWDVTSASRVDAFAANSRFIKSRIRKYWHRESTVVNPPVELDKFALSRGNQGYYLCFGQLVPYKRADLAVEAANRLGFTLKVAGDGGMLKELKAKAGPTVSFLGRVSEEEKLSLYAGCRGLIFPGAEDFGIVPVEAQACGKPVIAYGRGGALETVVDGKTGVLFPEQTVDSLVEAVRRFESLENTLDPQAIRDHAGFWAESRFALELQALVDETALNLKK